MTLEDALADLDDLKTALYALVYKGQLASDTNDEAQELLREVYTLLDQ